MALSTSPLISASLRDRIFQPGAHDWAYGWFVTNLPAGEPGAGQVRAEMRGDTPGNFFAWIIRYPEQDAVIIVLRNGCGSTENLEGNLQAILFDAEPRWPHRSPKDLFARAWQVPLAGAHSHPALTCDPGSSRAYRDFADCAEQGTILASLMAVSGCEFPNDCLAERPAL